jgi:hypothetical protein
MHVLIARTRRLWARLSGSARSLLGASAPGRLAIACPRCGARFTAPSPEDIDVLRRQQAWDVVAWVDEQQRAAMTRLVADCPHHRARFHADALTWRRVMA